MTVIQLDAARRRLLQRRAEERSKMPDITALELAERDVSAGITTTSLATEVRRFVVGALLTAALAAAGTVLFTLALAAAVVGSPVLAVGMAYLLVRRVREARARPAAIPAF